MPGDNPGRKDRLVLSEEAAVEVLAYLITAARTQLVEAAEYAPLRLVGAARKLAEHLSATASTPVRDLISSLESLPSHIIQTAHVATESCTSSTSPRRDLTA